MMSTNVKMDSQAFHAVIFHLARQDKSAKEIHQELVETYGENACHYSTVARWVQEFKWGRKDLAPRKSSGRPPEAITGAKIDAAK